AQHSAQRTCHSYADVRHVLAQFGIPRQAFAHNRVVGDSVMSRQRADDDGVVDVQAHALEFIDLLQVDNVLIAQDMGFQRHQQLGAAGVEGCRVTMPDLEGKRLVKAFWPVKKKSLWPHYAPRLPRLAATPSSGAASHHQGDSPKATAP